MFPDKLIIFPSWLSYKKSARFHTNSSVYHIFAIQILFGSWLGCSLTRANSPPQQRRGYASALMGTSALPALCRPFSRIFASASLIRDICSMTAGAATLLPHPIRAIISLSGTGWVRRCWNLLHSHNTWWTLGNWFSKQYGQVCGIGNLSILAVMAGVIMPPVTTAIVWPFALWRSFRTLSMTSSVIWTPSARAWRRHGGWISAKRWAQLSSEFMKRSFKSVRSAKECPSVAEGHSAAHPHQVAQALFSAPWPDQGSSSAHDPRRNVSTLTSLWAMPELQLS